MMAFLGMPQEAKIIDAARDKFKPLQVPCSMQHFVSILSYLANFCRTSNEMVNFRKRGYKVQKIQVKSFDVYTWQYQPGEFVLGILWNESGNHSNICCFCDKFVFDSNFKYALPLTKESLDTICQESFKRRKRGLYFHKRDQYPFKCYQSRKRRPRQP
jgi:hypothetical protein